MCLSASFTLCVCTFAGSSHLNAKRGNASNPQFAPRFVCGEDGAFEISSGMASLKETSHELRLLPTEHLNEEIRTNYALDMVKYGA